MRDGSTRMRSGSWNSRRSSSLWGSAKMSGMSSLIDRAGLHADGAGQHQPSHRGGRLGREFGGDPAADRAADHIDLCHGQPVQQFEIDVGDVVHRIDPVGQAGFAESRMRRRDQATPRRQQTHIGVLRHEPLCAVQEQKGLAITIFEQVKLDAGDRDRSALQGTFS